MVVGQYCRELGGGRMQNIKPQRVLSAIEAVGPQVYRILRDATEAEDLAQNQTIWRS